jgi:hypothetical protein
MNTSSMQFQIQQLRQDKINASVSSIAVFVFALFSVALLPQLIFQYFYAGQQLLEQPKVLELIPLTAFLLGVIHFLSVAFTNAIRTKKINELEEELKFMDDGCQCKGDCKCGDSNWDDLDELDAMVEEAIAEAKKTKKPAKPAKPAKKASKTKTKSKKVSAKKASKKKK